jgi:hypothetical protein
MPILFGHEKEMAAFNAKSFLKNHEVMTGVGELCQRGHQEQK